MPANTNLILQAGRVNPSNVGETFNALLQNIGKQDAIKQQREQAPIRNQILQQQAQAGQQANTAEAQKQRITSVAQGAAELFPFLESGDIAGGRAALVRRKAQIVADNQNRPPNQQIDTTETDEAIAMIDSGQTDLLKARTGQAVELGRKSGLFKGSTGVQASQFIPGKGFATLDKSGQASLVPVEGVGETAIEKRSADLEKSKQIEQEKSRLQGRTSAVRAAVSKGSKAFDKIQPISLAISNYDDAIKSIDEGASTGVISSMLPSFRKASIELDNITKRLGLDVVGNTTFGALSESELKFALSAAIPSGLQPKDLKQWLIAKRNAQRKVKERVEEAASFLSDGTHTIPDWIEFDKARQLNTANQDQQSIGPPLGTAQPGDAERNRQTLPAQVDQPIEVQNLSDEDLFN